MPQQRLGLVVIASRIHDLRQRERPDNLRGMFGWRLDNDHGLQGQEEDVEPTFTGAKAIYDTVQAHGNGQ
jgi:hypothetical protein